MASKSSESLKPISGIKPHRSPINLKEANVPRLTTESKRALRNLMSFRFAPLPTKLHFPRSRCAAVLVALFIGRKGDLYVLLSRRSSQLRSYAGDTSLPGGKVDKDDPSFEDAARREAFEEIGLPRDPAKVPLLCVMEPVLAGNGLVVTPVVVLILDNTIQPILQPAEVHTLFSHPLRSFLSEVPPFPQESELDEVPYHTTQDWEWDGPPARRRRRRRISSASEVKGESVVAYLDEAEIPRKIKLHSFLTGREAGGIKPVYGLTASILIEVAVIAYPHLYSRTRNVPFEIHAPSAPTWNERICWAMWKRREEWQKACEAEGLKLDWEEVGKIAGVPKEERSAALLDLSSESGADGRKGNDRRANRRKVRSKL